MFSQEQKSSPMVRRRFWYWKVPSFRGNLLIRRICFIYKIKSKRTKKKAELVKQIKKINVFIFSFSKSIVLKISSQKYLLTIKDSKKKKEIINLTNMIESLYDPTIKIENLYGREE